MSEEVESFTMMITSTSSIFRPSVGTGRKNGRCRVDSGSRRVTWNRNRDDGCTIRFRSGREWTQGRHWFDDYRDTTVSSTSFDTMEKSE